MTLNNIEATLRTFVEQKLAESFPELSTVMGSTIEDLFVNPLIEVLTPFIMTLDRIDIVQDLSNADLMTTEELDRIGVNNYGVSRIPGSAATTNVYVEMNPEYVGPDPVVIGPILVSTSDGLKYSSSDSTIIKYAESDVITIGGTVLPGVAADYLNTSTGKYEFPILVTAQEEGTLYNVDAGTITVLETEYPLLNSTVTNKEDAVDGLDSETNAAYAARILSTYANKNAGSDPWYKQYLIDNFNYLYDVFVCGFNDELMERDTAIIREGGYNVSHHIGGKVDLYIRGSYTDSNEQIVYVAADKIRLINPALRTPSSIAARNITNPANNDLAINLIYENSATKEGWVEAQIVAGPSTTLPATGDKIEVRYNSFLDGTLTDTCVYSQTFFYNESKFRFEKLPLGTITKIFNNTKNVDISLTDAYTIEHEMPVVEIATCPDQTSAGTNQILLNSNYAVRNVDYYVGDTVVITAGTGIDQTKTITAYDYLTGLCTVDSDWTTKPDTTSTYKIIGITNYLEGSAKEPVNIVLNMSKQVGDPLADAFAAGDQVTVTYTYERLIQDIQDDIELKEARIITTDVVAKKATPIYVCAGMTFKTVRDKAITTDQKIMLSTLIQNYMLQVSFEGDIQVSDLISKIYADSGIKEFLDFIYQPIVFFSSTSPITYTDEQVFALSGADYTKSVLSFKNAQYPVLGKLAVQNQV